MDLIARRFAMMGQQASEPDTRFYLYKNGDTCDANSGGWTILDNKVTLENGYMAVKHAGYADPFIRTVFEFSNVTMLGIEYERVDVGGAGTYSLRSYVGTKRVILPNNSSDGKFVVEQAYNNSGAIQFASYFGSWRIYKVWIETSN